MAEYIAPGLEQGGQKFEYREKKINGKNTEYLIGNPGIIILVTSPYPRDNLENLIKTAKQQLGPDKITLPVFYKDGQNYFRSAAFTFQTSLKSMKYKEKPGYSLSHYPDEQIRNMIALTPAEISTAKNKGIITYYQPESQKLHELIKTYEFQPVTYRRRPGPWPETEQSERIMLYANAQEHTAPLRATNKQITKIKKE